MARLSGVGRRILRVGMPVVPKSKISYRLAFEFGLTDFVGISDEINNKFKNSIFLKNKIPKNC